MLMTSAQTKMLQQRLLRKKREVMKRKKGQSKGVLPEVMLRTRIEKRVLKR
jgi:hypothetical protein